VTAGPDAVVVGAGIAGLTAAIALDRIGLDVQVVERATALTEAGTALSLWPNALAALRHIGLGEAVAGIGTEEPAGVVRKPSGRLIMTLDQSRLHRQLGTPTLVVHRGDLQRCLLDAASHLPIRMETSVARVGTEGGVGRAELRDGEVLTAPLVLACDGIHSVARSVVPNPPVSYRGRTSWRAVIGGASDLVPGACLTAGAGQQFIASRLRGDAVYWAADVGLPEGANALLADRREFLLRAFSGWHDPITELIARTDGDGLVIADLYDSVPSTLRAGRVVVLGDAAHPMTPDLGQGACQAIEDGVSIAAFLDRHPDPEVALARYEAARLPRARQMVRESRLLGVLATAESPALTALRDAAARMPDWLNARLVARYASEASFLATLPPGGDPPRPRAAGE
jgi:2-polyprenyl-6-methoxyphenol hydroxylase-like FAD-dependent oxidoreductase